MRVVRDSGKKACHEEEIEAISQEQQTVNGRYEKTKRGKRSCKKEFKCTRAVKASIEEVPLA